MSRTAGEKAKLRYDIREQKLPNSEEVAYYPVIQDRISVEPLFDRQEIAADLSLKGRIRLFVLVLTAAQVWFNRDFQYVFKRVKKYRKSLTEEDHG